MYAGVFIPFQAVNSLSEHESSLLKKLIELRFDSDKKAFHSVERQIILKILVEYYKEAGVDVKQCFGSVNYDAFKPLLKKGRDAEGWIEKAAEIVKASASH